MRIPRQRMRPLEAAQWDEEQREILAPLSRGGQVFNIFKTLIRHPKLLKRWLPFANHILGKSTLSPREREILILRVGWKCEAPYEWAQHVVIGKRAGLQDLEIERIKEGAGAPGWTTSEAALLNAADELLGKVRIGDETWAILTAHYDTRQLMDIVFTVGNYSLVSMALNTFGVPLDEGLRL